MSFVSTVLDRNARIQALGGTCSVLCYAHEERTCGPSVRCSVRAQLNLSHSLSNRGANLVSYRQQRLNTN
eukprot:157757-Amphidinium_carterae.1